MSTNILPVTTDLRSEGGLAAYIQFANQAPMLSAEEERELAVRFHEEDDLEAARQLVIAHLRHVIRVARGFAGYGLPQADLIQEGNIGLMKAVKHFDPQRGVRLVSFAVHWIRAEIYDFVLQNWRIVKVATTKAQRKLFFNLRKKRARLGWMNGAEVDRIAGELDVDRKDVLEMEGRLGHHDTSFEAGNSNGDEDAFAPAAWIQDRRFDPAELVIEADSAAHRSDQLQGALAKLDDRSRDIVQRRWLGEEKPTLHTLAAEYGISAERIRQIEKHAMGQMRESLGD
ncbi:MAG: RNA polymerase sigma factor RpoH [Gammaproteobacteria bacterium]|jgi:RNA polymerase sigma-32 factor|nr:RNA polymerase sigma factor RpoH [Gammaproteobacteria bacterium]